MNKIQISLLIVFLFAVGRNAYSQQDVTLLKIEAKARDSITAITRMIELHPNDSRLYSSRSFFKGLIKDYIGAIADLREVAKRKPEDAMTYYLISSYEKDMGDLMGAMRDLGKSIELNPNSPIAWLLRGEVKFDLEDYMGAYQDYSTSIEMGIKMKLSTILMEAYYNRGVVQVYYLNNKMSGCLDLSKSGELGYKYAYDIIKERCN